MTTLDSRRTTDHAARARTLSIAYTPDSDDAFNYCAWESGRITIPGCAARFERAHITVLNHAAAAGLHDVVAVSSVMYPALADRYRILAAGASIGRGYGPVLVARKAVALPDLAGRRIAVADVSTTGGMLARMYCPFDAQLVATPYDLIADAILAGEVDAGVMIHEELVHYPALGLLRVRDLGAAWTEDTGLPLPVGLNLVRRSLGRALAVEIARACRDSLRWGLEHRDEAIAFASRFGRGRADAFVPMFCNDDTLCMPDDVRRALRVLFDRVAGMGYSRRLESFEVIDA